MNYESAYTLASETQTPIRRSGWPQGHHAKHVAESDHEYRLHTAHPTPQPWSPSEEDRSAEDWETHTSV